MKIMNWLKAFVKGLVEKLSEIFVRSKLPQLQELPFFHSVYFESTGHKCPGWKSPEGAFHSDAPVAIVVTRKGKVSGVVGFELIGSTIFIRQLQGAPRGNFNDGTKVEEYLLYCAEEIAKALGMKVLRILTPETAIAYREASPPQDRPSEVAKVHMRKIYSFPEKVGYALVYFWRIRQPTHYRLIA